MLKKLRLPPLVAAVALSGCAIPTGPSVMVLPGSGKTIEQFQADETFCRQWAGQQISGTAGGSTAVQSYGSAAQWRYDMAYQQCMYAKGHRLPGVSERYGPAPPPQTPPPTAPGPPPPAAVPAPRPQGP